MFLQLVKRGVSDSANLHYALDSSSPKTLMNDLNDRNAGLVPCCRLRHPPTSEPKTKEIHANVSSSGSVHHQGMCSSDMHHFST